MRKLVIAAALLMMMLSQTGCTDNTMVRHYGFTKTVALPNGVELLQASWYEDGLWYLTAPMDSGYVPKNKTLTEMSKLGLIEGEVVFIESK